MEMKWTSIIDGDLSGIPQQENLLFTIFDERRRENYVAAGWVLENEGEFEVGGVDPWGLNSNETKKVKARPEFHGPYKPNKCSDCEHWKEGVDSYGDPWAQCELIVDPPFLFSNEQYFKCPLNR